MNNFFLLYGLFLAKIITTFIIVALFLMVIIALRRGRATNNYNLEVDSLNDYYDDQKNILEFALLNENERKKIKKERKKAEKKERKESANNIEKTLNNLFVIDFDGDIDASDVETLRDTISTIIQFAKKEDKVLLRLESGGGYVHSYGLAAAQLQRLKAHDIHLTIAVDKVAASGGYMMACVANNLIAAPFAIIGSIGVIGALPNFNQLLKKNNIEYEQHTAGKHKRSLTIFGENSDEDRAQFKYELEKTHVLFKEHIANARPNLNMNEIATGETWYAIEAINKGLIDEISTSDDFIIKNLEDNRVLLLSYNKDVSIIEKIKEHFMSMAIKLITNIGARVKI